VQVIMIDTARPEHSVKPVSSAEVRDLMAVGNWEGLRARGWLHPRVLAALEAAGRA